MSSLSQSLNCAYNLHNEIHPPQISPENYLRSNSPRKRCGHSRTPTCLSPQNRKIPQRKRRLDPKTPPKNRTKTLPNKTQHIRTRRNSPLPRERNSPPSSHKNIPHKMVQRKSAPLSHRTHQPNRRANQSPPRENPNPHIPLSLGNLQCAQYNHVQLANNHGPTRSHRLSDLPRTCPHQTQKPRQELLQTPSRNSPPVQNHQKVAPRKQPYAFALIPSTVLVVII